MICSPCVTAQQEPRTWWGWMRDPAVWDALTRCQPWPTPQRLARAYRKRFGRSPAGGSPGQPHRYSRAEVLELAAWLQGVAQ